MRVSLKVLASLWVGLLLIIGLLLFNAYSKIRPELLVNLVSEELESNYPGSKLTVGNVSYGFSLDFNLSLQNLSLRRSEKIITSIGEIEFKIPWWLLLFNRGNAQINISQLNIFLDHNEAQPYRAVESRKKSTIKIKVKLPAYLSDAKYTVRATDVSISDIDTSRRYFMISKLLVREFNFHKNSAFELHVPISIKNRSSQYFSDLWLFGDITPDSNEWLINFRGDFRTRENNEKFQIEDLVIGGTAKLNPNEMKLLSDIELLIDKKNVGRGQVTANDENVTLKLNITNLPANFLSFIYEEIKNPYLVEPQGEAFGSIKFQKNLDTSIAKVSGHLAFDGVLQLTDQHSLAGKWKIGLQDTRWEVSFISPKGEASFFRRSIFDTKKTSMSQFVEELGFSGLDLNMISSPIIPIGKFITEVPKHYFTTTISYKNCFSGEQKLNGEFRYGVTPEKRFYKGSLNGEKSSIDISYSDKNEENSLEVNLVNFNWAEYYQFLTPFFAAKSGLLNGKISGNWLQEWQKGNWSFKFFGNNVVGSEGKFSDFMNQTLSFFEISPKNFNKQSINISSNNGHFNLNSIFFEASDNMKISGILGLNKKSFLNYYSSKTKKFEKKEVPATYWYLQEEI